MKTSANRYRTHLSLGILAAVLAVALGLVDKPLAQTGDSKPLTSVAIAIKRGGLLCRTNDADFCYILFAPKDSESNAVLKVQGQTATIELTKEWKKQPETITIFEDWPVPAEVAKKLGFEGGCTLLKGEYRVNYSSNKLGIVEGVKLRGA